MDLTTIQLTNEEAILFMEFQKRYSFMQLLNSIGAFSLKNGSININFDGMGRIAKVEKKEYLIPAVS